MSSLLTNASAMTALQTLSLTNKNMATTQNRIATGERVSGASDNAAYWSIATTMRSDNKAISSVQDSLGLGAGKVDTAYTGMNAAIEVVDEIKQKLVSAIGASAGDREKIQTEVSEFLGQLAGIAQSANYAGSNLLANAGDATADLSIVSSYNRAADGTVTVEKLAVVAADSQLTAADGTFAGLLAGFDAMDDTGISAAADDAAIEAFLSTVETALTSMTEAASTLGASKKRIDMQADFTSKLSDAIERGVGQLVDADMNAESARLSALQTQQQLGIQALSIANQSSQNILSLFR
ncbi:flagellin [Aliihoeflea aestuarii]|jgi:flagellin|uniref:flagellin N-terminal helical domain-containing protein n=1 Tax=Aliihoeflea aestuarii TaxID=453840 RepID=UPI0020965689|nr:flagellin [Aliihoeflea aestuarii]MCO6392892.1 flagellin [Aliihoeflea aestuarii]